ncbi:Hypothetical protein PROPJV5_0733 [Propionibacterium ruminifibrarum]|uniref:Uncharacterized protein n=1 Tax=Propionibacterium ruminifibrarum TaxID=1962131 RepID=A0A375HZJ8_9ACTN|nr:hypothetical protein [Propionibacterium ruminifibrarum]SPF67774.1 Hypothetical protein PROPJV5_0733 [Propionibacterium ruminifibrarum]
MSTSEELLAFADRVLPEPASEDVLIVQDIAMNDDESIAYGALDLLVAARVTIPEDLLLRALDDYSDSWTFVELATEALERQRQNVA